MKKNKRSVSPQNQNVKKIQFIDNKFFAPVAFIVIFLAHLILFSEFIFSDKMLNGSDMINAGIFFRSFLVDSVLNNGSVPQWNPYIFGGLPFVDAFHGDLFYPLSFLKYFGELYRMLGMILFWHIFLAGIFMYLCARQFKLDKIPSLLAGVSYMFAPYLVAMLAPGHDGKIFTITLFPLAVMFLDQGFNAQSIFKSFFHFSMMGLVIGFIILSPHAQMSYFSLWALALYTLFRMIIKFIDTKKLPGVIRPGVFSAYAVVIGLLLSAIQFYPGYKYTSDFSPRADTKKGWEWATSWSMHEEEAFSLLVPEFSGTSTRQAQTVYWGKNDFKDNSETIGIVAIFAALIGVFFSRKREAYFFAGLAVFALLYALGATTPLFHLFYLIPKVASMRAPSMIMFLFSFSISLLAGYGLQWLLTSPLKPAIENKKFSYLLWGFPGFMFVLALLFTVSGRGMLKIWTFLFYENASKPFTQGYTKLDLAYSNLSAIQSGAWFAFLAVAICALMIWLYKSGKVGQVIFLVLITAGMFNDIRFDKRFISTVDPKPYWDKNIVVDYFDKQEGQYRVMDFARVFSENYLPQFNIPLTIGYHGNQLRWYDKLVGGPGKTNSMNPNFINLTGSKYLILQTNQQLPPNYLGPKPVTTDASFGSIKILVNHNTLPRLFLVDQYKKYDDPDLLYSDIMETKDDLSEVVYLEVTPQLQIELDSLNTDSAWFIDYQTDSISIGLKVTKNKLLVLTDNDYESWQAEIDGNEAEILRAYGSFRAVEIPAGSQELKFRYYSKTYNTGKTITALTTIYLTILCGLFVFFHYRENKISHVE